MAEITVNVHYKMMAASSTIVINGQDMVDYAVDRCTSAGPNVLRDEGGAQKLRHSGIDAGLPQSRSELLRPVDHLIGVLHELHPHLEPPYAHTRRRASPMSPTPRTLTRWSTSRLSLTTTQQPTLPTSIALRDRAPTPSRRSPASPTTHSTHLLTSQTMRRSLKMRRYFVVNLRFVVGRSLSWLPCV